ncbi:MAG: antitoxin Xre/MbcA/ParS toxin-binding domain-containing protein [Candidatus Cyclobacteriaceae bacterium M3_2C_046]
MENRIEILSSNDKKIGSISVGSSNRYFISEKVLVANEKSYALNSKTSGFDPVIEQTPSKSQLYKATRYATLKFKQTESVFQYLGYNQKEIADILEIDASTLSRWKKSKKDESLNRLQTKVVLDIDQLIAKGIRIFGSEENLKGWLNSPNFALGDVAPIELIKDPYGIEMADSALEAISWGNFI